MTERNRMLDLPELDPTKPRVVLFRHSSIDRDTRAKKFALTLQRSGFDVVIVSTETPGSPSGEARLGTIPVLRIPYGEVVSIASPAMQERRERIGLYTRQARTLAGRWSGRSAKGKATDGVRLALALGRRSVLSVVDEGERRSLQARRLLRGALNRVSKRTGHYVLVPGMDPVRLDLPVVIELERSLTDTIVALRPDILHVHHPWLLRTAFTAKDALVELGGSPKVVYDARENFAGLPAKEVGNLRAHQAMLSEERSFIGRCDSTSTVSEPIVDVLHERYRLAKRPRLILNTPIGGVADAPPQGTVRDVAGVGDDVTLLVYSGGISWARGLETLVDGMAHLPENVHLAIVSVPFPHPMEPFLQERAENLGLGHRIHVMGPVDQSVLFGYLSGADIAVHPLPGGSPNHDAAMPNKLFEYLHAGLPLVVSDAKLMAEFVSSHRVGQVFRSQDAVAFANAVLRELESPSDPAAARALAQERSWQNQEADIATAYAELAGVAPHLPQGEYPSLQVTDIITIVNA